MMTHKPKYEQRLLLEQVNQLYEQSHIATLGSATVAIIIGIILWPMVNHVNLILWSSAAVAITLFRQAVIVRFHRLKVTPQDAPRWKRLFFRLILTSGIIWGSSALVIFPKTSFTHQIFLFSMLIGLVSGAVATFSAILPVFLAYMIPTLLPLLIVFLLGGTPMQFAMSAVLLFYLILVSMSAYLLYKKTRTSMMLQFENIDLIHFLEEEKHRADTINKELKNEVKERIRIEKMLQKHRENLEAMVDERTNALKASNIDLKIEIAERKKTENALKDSEEKYRLLVENANDAIFIYQNSVCRFHNKRTEELLGFSAAELHETPITELCKINDSQFIHGLVHRSPDIQAPVAAGKTIRFINKENQSLWIQLTAVPVTWDDAPALLCFMRDVTQQTNLEKQLLQAQKIEAIGTMAAGIAHDFNNILSGIQGNTSLALLHIDEKNEFYHKFKDIESYISSGTELTRQLLNFASPRSSERKPVDISHLINDTASMFCRTKKEVRLHTFFNNTNTFIEADSGQIRQALINLLVNAWQAMPGGGDIDIATYDVRIDNFDTLAYEIPPGAYIKISVRDTGAGMDPSEMSKIFDPFFTTKKDGEGTGLGLSSVYGIIKSHDGYIDVESKPGFGSTFHIFLPASLNRADPGLAAEEPIIKGTETILIVDDEPDILEIGKEMLEALGYRVYAASNGSQAIDIYKNNIHRIQLIILDMIMPDMNGEQTYAQLIKIDPDVKVLLSSGFSQNDQAARILEKGCNGFIQKPFKIQLLSQTIRKIIHAAPS